MTWRPCSDSDMLRRLIKKLLFSQRAVKHWNALKQHTVDCNTVTQLTVLRGVWTAILNVGDFYKLMLLFHSGHVCRFGNGAC